MFPPLNSNGLASGESLRKQREQRESTLMVALTSCNLNKVSMSVILCVNSRYTVPRKLSGTESWKRSWLMRTRSPTVIAPPPTIFDAAIHIIPVKAVEKIMFWPEFSNANEVAILSEDFSYDCIAESYSLT